MKKNIHIILSVISMCSLSSCSVAMAAKKDGSSIQKIQKCHNRMNFLALGGSVISSETLENGDLVETYTFKTEKGSISRAVMHGLLDISTCCIWEVIGTPIEGSYSNDFFSVKVIYDKDENIKSIMLN